eukprot:764531-Hanusia_phi.AAC.2
MVNSTLSCHGTAGGVLGKTFRGVGVIHIYGMGSLNSLRVRVMAAFYNPTLEIGGIEASKEGSSVLPWVQGDIAARCQSARASYMSIVNSLFHTSKVAKTAVSPQTG